MKTLLRLVVSLWEVDLEHPSEGYLGTYGGGMSLILLPVPGHQPPWYREKRKSRGIVSLQLLGFGHAAAASVLQKA